MSDGRFQNHNSQCGQGDVPMKDLTNEEERQLLDECISQNRCDRLVEQYGRLIYSTVRQVFVIRGAALLREDLEEAHQDVFVQLFDDNRRRLRLYRQGEGYSLGRWIRKIASNSAKNYLRKKGFDSPFGQFWGEELDGDFADSEITWLDSIKKLSLVKGLEKLELMDRIIFKLRLYGMTSKEIAVIVESTEGGINNKIWRIGNRLRELMSE